MGGCDGALAQAGGRGPSGVTLRGGEGGAAKCLGTCRGWRRQHPLWPTIPPPHRSSAKLLGEVSVGAAGLHEVHEVHMDAVGTSSTRPCTLTERAQCPRSTRCNVSTRPLVLEAECRDFPPSRLRASSMKHRQQWPRIGLFAASPLHQRAALDVSFADHFAPPRHTT